MVRPSGTEAPGARKCGQADVFDELRARVSSWPPLRLARLRRERESVGVVSPTAPVKMERRCEMRRVIGIDLHRTFGEVVIWKEGRLRSLGRVDMTRTALEGLSGIERGSRTKCMQSCTPTLSRNALMPTCSINAGGHG